MNTENDISLEAAIHAIKFYDCMRDGFWEHIAELYDCKMFLEPKYNLILTEIISSLFWFSSANEISFGNKDIDDVQPRYYISYHVDESNKSTESFKITKSDKIIWGF